MLTVGDTFPTFAVKAVKGGPEGLNLKTCFTDITSDSDAGKWKIVFFWPKDFTFVCPTEIVAFGELERGLRRSRHAARLRRASIDSEFVHVTPGASSRDELAATGRVPHGSSDVKRELAAGLRRPAPDRGRGAARDLHRRSAGHRPLRVQVNDLSVGRNPQEVLRALDALQTDELCPCNWHQGDDHAAGRLSLSRRLPWRPAVTSAAGRWSFQAHVPHGDRCRCPSIPSRPSLPDYAKDLKLNLASVLATEPALTPQQRCRHVRSPPPSPPAMPNGRPTPSPPRPRPSIDRPKALDRRESRGRHHGHEQRLLPLRPPRLEPATTPDHARQAAHERHRCEPGVDKLDFELWSLAVSAINGCGMCIDSHEKVVRQRRPASKEHGADRRPHRRRRACGRRRAGWRGCPGHPGRSRRRLTRAGLAQRRAG